MNWAVVFQAVLITIITSILQVRLKRGNTTLEADGGPGLTGVCIQSQVLPHAPVLHTGSSSGGYQMHFEIREKPLLSRPAWQRWGPLGLVTTKNTGWLVSFPMWWDKARSVSAVLKGAGTLNPPRLTPGHLFHVSRWGEGDAGDVGRWLNKRILPSA